MQSVRGTDCRSLISSSVRTKGAQALELFLLKAQQRGCFGIHLRMLRRKKLEPCLYERQRRAELVRRIAGELPLRVK